MSSCDSARGYCRLYDATLASDAVGLRGRTPTERKSLLRAVIVLELDRITACDAERWTQTAASKLLESAESRRSAALKSSMREDTAQDRDDKANVRGIRRQDCRFLRWPTTGTHLVHGPVMRQPRTMSRTEMQTRKTKSARCNMSAHRATDGRTGEQGYIRNGKTGQREP